MNDGKALYIAEIGRREQCGEQVFHAAVFIGQHKLWSIKEQPSLQAVQIEVLDWAQRLGKRDVLGWVYQPSIAVNNMRTEHKYDLDGVMGAIPLVMESPAAPAKAEGTRLSLGEYSLLRAYEQTIKEGMDKARLAWTALLEIRDKRLYRDGYGSFEEYCGKKWGISARHGHRLADAGEVVAGLLTDGKANHHGDTAKEEQTELPVTVLPETESQARVLKSVQPEKRREVWNEAVAQAGGKAPTARQVREVVNKEAEARSEAAKQTGFRRLTPDRHAMVIDAKRAAENLAAVANDISNWVSLVDCRLRDLQLSGAKHDKLEACARFAADLHERVNAMGIGSFYGITIKNMLDEVWRNLSDELSDAEDVTQSRQDAKVKARAQQSVKDKATAAAELFVICRETEPYGFGKDAGKPRKPRYASVAKPPGYARGWTTDPNKAEHYPKNDEHIITARESGDKVVPLAKAIRRFEKGL